MLCVKTRGIVAMGAIALLILSGVASLQLRKDVTLKADDEVYKVSTYSSTVEEVLEQHNIDLEPEDRVIPDLGVKLEDNMEIEVMRALNVWVFSDEELRSVKTQPTTVAELLAKADIALGELDKVDPHMSQHITASETIRIIRVKEEITEEIRPVPFEVVTRGDNTMPFGEKKVLQSGEEGEEKVVTTRVLEDGEVISEEISTEIVRPSKPKVVAKGTIQLASRGGDQFEYSEVYTMNASAYSYDAGSRTALGTDVRVGAVAVDPKVIPLRSKLYIDGYGFAVAEDTGGSIKGMKIDLFMNSTEEAYRFGRRSVRVYLLKE